MSNGDTGTGLDPSTIDASAAGAGVGGPVSPGAQASQMPPWLQQLAKVVASGAGIAGKMIGGGGSTGPGMTPGVVGTQIGPTPPAAMAGQAPPNPMNRGVGPGSGVPLPAAASPGRPGWQGGTGTEGQFMSQLTPQAAGLFQGIQGFQKVMQDKQAQKDKEDSAEAANVAQNLMKALDTAQNSPDERTRAEAMQTVDMILKNKEYSKVLDKVYKGWLQKADQQKKAKSKEVDPETAGFEQGLQAYFQGKGAAPQMPSQLQGYRLPTGGMPEQMKMMQQQALYQMMQKDPTLAAYGPEGALKIQEMQARLAEAGEAVKVAQAHSQEAQLGVQRAQLEYDTARELGPVKEKEYETKLAEEKLKADIAQLNLDKTNALLEIAKSKLANPKEPPATAYTKLRGLASLSRNLDALIANPPSWRFGGAPQSLRDLAGTLRTYGMSGAASKIPTGTGNFFVDTKSILESIKGDLDEFRDSYTQGLQEQYKGWTPPGESPRAAASVAAPSKTTPVDTKNWKPYSGTEAPPDVVWQSKPPKATQMFPAKDGKWYWTDDNATPISPVTAPPAGGK